ncbi:MAG: hypothetical protein ACE1ZA_12385 [Pseudomonadales bacterium]
MSLHSLVLIVVATISGCGGGTPVSPVSTLGVADAASSVEVADVPMVIELRYDETANYRHLKFRWIKLEDSRCQTGVQCVWAGQLVATIEVARGKEAPVEVELVHRIGSEPKETTIYGYELRLQDVNPHPKKGVTHTRSDHVMRFEISKP